MNVYKMSVLQRMVLTALMLALYTVATRFVMVPVTPYVRLSAGIAILIFSSIMLGPIAGAVIGVAGDLLGAVIMPYMGNVVINPFMTISYGLMGATPALIMILFRKFKKKDLIYSILFFTLLTVIVISLTIYMSIAPSITLFDHEFTINLVARILVPIIALIIMSLFGVFTYFLNKRFKKRREELPNLPSPYQVSFIVVVVEVVFTLFINVFAKMWLMEVKNFEIIFFPSLFLAFIYIPANTVIVTYLCFLASKTIKIRE
ncbi:MAG: ECF transporter S component [Bacilli bacterium]|nr:ECF transporter S component [Bacilli bacterium]